MSEYTKLPQVIVEDDEDDDEEKFPLADITLRDAIKNEETFRKIRKRGDVRGSDEISHYSYRPLQRIYNEREDLPLDNEFFSFIVKEGEESLLTPSETMNNEYESMPDKLKPRFNMYTYTYYNDIYNIESIARISYYKGIKAKSKYFIKIYSMYYFTENLKESQYKESDLKKWNSNVNINLSRILSEIYFQKKAESTRLKNKCSYTTPKIIKYGFLEGEKTLSIKYFYILYENIGKNTKMLSSFLNEKECCEVVELLKVTDRCLRKNNIFHNDLHANNVYYNIGESKKLGLLDFGEAAEIKLYERDIFPKCGINCNENNRGGKKRRHTKRRRQVAGGVGSKKWANMSARSQLAQNTALAREMEDAAAADRKKWSTLYRNMLEAVNVDAAVADAVVVSKEVKRATRSRRHARSLENEPDIKECIRKCNYSCRKKGGKSKRRR